MPSNKRQWKFFMPVGSLEHAGEADCLVRAVSGLLGEVYGFAHGYLQAAIPSAEFFKDSSKGFTLEEVSLAVASLKRPYTIVFPFGKAMLVKDCLKYQADQIVVCHSNGSDHVTVVRNRTMLDTDEKYLYYKVDRVYMFNGAVDSRTRKGVML